MSKEENSNNKDNDLFAIYNNFYFYNRQFIRYDEVLVIGVVSLTSSVSNNLKIRKNTWENAQKCNHIRKKLIKLIHDI